MQEESDWEAVVTIARRLGPMRLALILLGAGAAYYAATSAAKGQLLPPGRLSHLVLVLLAGLTVLVLLVYLRGVGRSTRILGSQLDAMSASGRIGPVMVEKNNELVPLVRPLNEFIAATRAWTEKIRSESRQLQLQVQVASAEKRNTEALIYSISDAVIGTNRFDELVLANPTAEKLLGFGLTGSLHSNIENVISDGTVVRLIRETRSCGRGGTATMINRFSSTISLIAD